MTPASHQIGFEQATNMLRSGEFISPEQCYQDSIGLLPLWSDHEMFVLGVYDAIKISKGE